METGEFWPSGFRNIRVDGQRDKQTDRKTSRQKNKQTYTGTHYNKVGLWVDCSVWIILFLY